MSNSTKLRIVQDYNDFIKNRPDGIYFFMNKKNIFENYALIIGPKNTPYFGGYYIFKVKFPDNYPETSPSLKMLTIDGSVRLNPNLYECGKVCLSILGTWKGPSWSPVMTIRTVLLSVQSLFSDFPIRNEPGYESTKIDDERNIHYNRYILFHNYNLSIINIIENVLKLDPKVKITEAKYFKKEIIDNFKINYQQLNDDLKCYQLTIGETIINKVIYFLRKESFLDFINLNKEFDDLVENNKKKLKIK